MRWVVAVAVALALVGCGSDERPEVVDDAHTSATDVYVDYLEGEGIIPEQGTAEEFEGLGRDVCRAYEQGHTFSTVVETIRSGGFSEYEAGQINGAATAAFCPEHLTP